MWFNVQHSPIGAYTSLTFGHSGTRGGVSMQQGRPGSQNVFVGWQDEGSMPVLFPFFEAAADARSAYRADANLRSPTARILDLAEVSRHLGPATDRFEAGPLTLEVVSPRVFVADPDLAGAQELRSACCPVVLVRLALDNSTGTSPRRATFALESDQPFRPLEGTGGDVFGLAQGRWLALAAHRNPHTDAFCEFSIDEGLAQAGRRFFRLGKIGGFVVTAPPGTRREATFAVATHVAGPVTTGVETRFFYTRHFESAASAAAFGLAHRAVYVELARAQERDLAATGWSPSRQRLFSQAAHGYYASTAWLVRPDGRPLWVVAEGEYEMLNTVDLMVDQAFFELQHHPWTLRNQLEFLTERYAYEDMVQRPGGTDRLAGGVSFCHDQGVAMQFTPPGESSYEHAAATAGCFGSMGYEELCNFVICMALYVHATGDVAFARDPRQRLRDCWSSLENRDDPDPARRRGVMGCDGSRAGPGGEITTYDSLDGSLGPARGNLYIATKSWATHLAMETLALACGDDAWASEARRYAGMAARTIVSTWDPGVGYLPANPARDHAGAILPAIEPLVYPWALGRDDAWALDGPYAELLAALRHHVQAVLRPGRCLFPDGGWKLSSTSDNSWLSKIALAQHVATEILQLDIDTAASDDTHWSWLEGAGWWAASDQFVAGRARGSRFYPRLVSCAVWRLRA